jgi:FAD/FMN-containing dehydrogenase
VLATATQTGLWVNDVHSRLNATRVARVLRPTSLADLRQAVIEAGEQDESISIAGGRHAMGGQQFGADGVLVDTRDLSRVLSFDREGGTVEVESGIHWRPFVDDLLARQEGGPQQWGIAQKQTGADRLSIGGALSANVHGRGLRMKPFVGDVESFVLVDANANVLRCSRTENADLFRLAVGGYGMFGLVYSVKLRLAPRRKVRRVVREASADELAGLFRDRIEHGFLYGDFQFAVDRESDCFLRRGVFSCYEPVDETGLVRPDPPGARGQGPGVPAVCRLLPLDVRPGVLVGPAPAHDVRGRLSRRDE